MNNNQMRKKKGLIWVIIVLVVFLLIGFGGFFAYRAYQSAHRKNDNILTRDDEEEDEELTLEEKYPYYDFEEVKIYEESTNGEEFPKNGDKKYYQDFTIGGDQVLHINYDSSLCKEYTPTGEVAIYKEAGQLCRECAGKIVYVNYIFEEERGEDVGSVPIYVIDRQGYLFKANVNSMEVGIDRYSQDQVIKIGYKVNGNGILFVFEDESVIEFSSKNYLELQS